MFKSLGDLIHRTSWVTLIGGGMFVLVGLILFATPFQLLKLHETGKTPAERSAIKREINLAFGDRALTIAESVVQSMKSRSADPERIRELDSALAEMERARREIDRARSDVSKAIGSVDNVARDAASAAAQASQVAIDAATEAAQGALEGATRAREGMEQARDEALARLREQGADTTAVQKSFEDLLKAARANERGAREALAAMRSLPRRLPAPGVPAPVRQGSPSTPANPVAPAPPAAPDPARETSAKAAAKAMESGATMVAPGVIVIDTTKGSKPKGISIQFNTDNSKGPLAVLSPESRRDIRRKVAGDVWRIGIGSALIVLYIPLFGMLLIAKYLIGRSRRALAFAEEKKHEAKVSDINRQVTEARLQALQAQIEPHFLYNTLANVQALTEFDPPAANAMVGHLIQYLRAALPKMRESTSTVGQEIELIRAYLNILKMRMGARLEFGIDVPQDLLARPFPPMMLPSLVENAIKHGLETQREGGRIDVVARRVFVDGREQLRIEVRDTGRGLTDLPGSPVFGVSGGVGLTNLRERLHALHGDDARFSLEANTPRGAVATIEVPIAAQSAVAPSCAWAGNTAPPSGMAVEPVFPAPPPPKGWRRAWRATSRTHTVWASITSKLFFGLMFALAILFALSLIALYSGWMPMEIGDFELEGIEAKALGSVILLGAFILLAIVVAVLVAMFYGLGFVFAALLIVVPAAILIFLFPVLAPFIIVGLIIWWLWRRQKRRLARLDSAKMPGIHSEPTL